MLRFSGSVISEGGKLKSLDKVDVEKERAIIRPGGPTRVVVGPRGRVRAVGRRPAVVPSASRTASKKRMITPSASWLTPTMTSTDSTSRSRTR